MKTELEVNQTEKLLAKYTELSFNKEHFDTYKLKETIPEIMCEDEDAIMDGINHAICAVRDYPKMGEIYYDIIKSLYINERPIQALKKCYGMSTTTIYRYKRQAIKLIHDLLYKEVFAQ